MLKLGRVFVQERVVSEPLSLRVLDYEGASCVVREARQIGIGLCYCRHKMQHVGRACDAPLEICMTFGATAASLVKHGFARRADAAEGLDLLQQAQERGLVQFGDNVREGVGFICNCCRCCCEAMIAARRFALLHPVHTTNFICRLDPERCNGCGKCAEKCPVEALTLVAKGDPLHPKRKLAVLDDALCLGCGVCVRTRAREGLRLGPRAERVITPLDDLHRVVVMALERGKLQELIFDNQAHLSHRAMAAILGGILKLPPLKQALASRQVKSRYLEALLKGLAA